jgi:hypothetical protein|uniref:Uncharacterized protein n=1 Tax=Picea sitchensis TaxID=3332 RepID=A9NZT1_PICSI|nr:unknown [Picea sitchensis]
MADFFGAPCNYDCSGVMEFEVSGYGDMEAALPKRVMDKLLAWLHANLITSMQNHFGQITRALISSPGFNDTVNDYCGFLLDQATSSIPELKAAMFIPGARHRVLNVMKMQVKQALVLLLVGSGENYNDAKAFVDLYVTDTV